MRYKIRWFGKVTLITALGVVLGRSGSGGETLTNSSPTNLISIPLGLEPEFRVPKENPLTPEKVSLGRKLFFDPILSKNQAISCATCHEAGHGFASSTALPIGVDGHPGRRNAPSLFNRVYAQIFFWDGRSPSLEAQALLPIQSPTEMGTSLDEMITRIRRREEYRQAFGAAFSDGISAKNLAAALASFERTLLSGNSPVDRFRNGDVPAISISVRQGMWLFESRGLCWKCHAGRNFTDENFHNTGVSWGKSPLDLGRFEFTKEDGDRGRFKTPTLRNVAKTGPYMHDGSVGTLKEVVQFYNRGGSPNPNLDPILRPLDLSEDDVQNLVSFLDALTGENLAELNSTNATPTGLEKSK